MKLSQRCLLKERHLSRVLHVTSFNILRRVTTNWTRWRTGTTQRKFKTGTYIQKHLAKVWSLKNSISFPLACLTNAKLHWKLNICQLRYYSGSWGKLSQHEMRCAHFWEWSYLVPEMMLSPFYFRLAKKKKMATNWISDLLD